MGICCTPSAWRCLPAALMTEPSSPLCRTIVTAFACRCEQAVWCWRRGWRRGRGTAGSYRSVMFRVVLGRCIALGKDPAVVVRSMIPLIDRLGVDVAPTIVLIPDHLTASGIGSGVACRKALGLCSRSPCWTRQWCAARFRSECLGPGSRSSQAVCDRLTLSI